MIMNGYYLITLNGFKSKVNLCSLMRSCSFKDHIPEEREPVMFWTSSDQLSELCEHQRHCEELRVDQNHINTVCIHHSSSLE